MLFCRRKVDLAGQGHLEVWAKLGVGCLLIPSASHGRQRPCLVLTLTLNFASLGKS